MKKNQKAIKRLNKATTKVMDRVLEVSSILRKEISHEAYLIIEEKIVDSMFYWRDVEKAVCEFMETKEVELLNKIESM